MATNPMLQSVLLWHNHQATAPYLPGAGGPAAAIQPLENVEVSIPPPEAALPLEEKEPVEEVEEDDAESNGEDEENEETELMPFDEVSCGLHTS